VIELRAPRLRLRQWSDADLEPFAELNADPVRIYGFAELLRRRLADRTG